jgi:hypothetical protein
MFIPLLIGQEGGGIDWLTILLPLLFCFLCMGQGRGEGRSTDRGTVTDHWYTPQNIDEVYDSIYIKVDEWREDTEKSQQGSSLPFVDQIRKTLGGGGPQPRYVVMEEIKPRLISVMDRSDSIHFELIEVEDGGTVVKATFGSHIKAKIAKMKAQQPLKIPKTPFGSHCPACGKPTLEEFVLCPYCGEKLIKEE